MARSSEEMFVYGDGAGHAPVLLSEAAQKVGVVYKAVDGARVAVVDGAGFGVEDLHFAAAVLDALVKRNLADFANLVLEDQESSVLRDWLAPKKMGDANPAGGVSVCRRLRLGSGSVALLRQKDQPGGGYAGLVDWESRGMTDAEDEFVGAFRRAIKDPEACLAMLCAGAPEEMVGIGNSVPSASAVREADWSAEEISLEYCEQRVMRLQEKIRSEPMLAKTKAAYLLGDPQAAAPEDLVVQTAQTLLQRLQKLSAEASRDRDAPKALAFGAVISIPLDIEHLVADATLETKFAGTLKGRSYENPERFLSARMVMDELAAEAAGGNLGDKVSVRQWNEDAQGKMKFKVSEETRARASVTMLKAKLRQLSELERMFPAWRSGLSAEDLAKISGMEAASRLAEEERMAFVEKRAARIAASADGNAEEASAKERAVRAALAEVSEKLGKLVELKGREALPAFERRIKPVLGPVKAQEERKYVYGVSESGELLCTHDSVAPSAQGRSSHSELLGGKNALAAGEVFFAKDVSGRFVVKEINNGSGHYRPPAVTLPVAYKAFAAAGFDLAHASLNHVLDRNRRVREADFSVGLKGEVEAEPSAPAGASKVARPKT